MRAIPRRLPRMVSQTRSDKTWSNFKAHFARAFKDTRISSRTLKTKCYSAHVHTTKANVEIFTKMQQDHTLVLSNLVTATQAGRTLVALITKTISDLSRQVSHLTTKTATEQAENARMKKFGHHSTTAEHGYQESRNSTPSDPTSSQYQNM